ncbi:hypothetical protein ONE63_002898 [Megalurothrips usitatus]|uniref:Uncharacterized protein n=1 Tax=Megalurothrips usitatus TaxID=439358 RepID=A0AAV7X856_9NEOP|nr:hypothetical protein ONE63_002898 [Megalurothrips usitatus]
MDLIEVLWKQDVDLGFSLEYFNAAAAAQKAGGAANDSAPEPGSSGSGTTDELEKIKILNELNASEVSNCPGGRAEHCD